MSLLAAANSSRADGLLLDERDRSVTGVAAVMLGIALLGCCVAWQLFGRVGRQAGLSKAVSTARARKACSRALAFAATLMRCACRSSSESTTLSVPATPPTFVRQQSRDADDAMDDRAAKGAVFKGVFV